MRAHHLARAKIGAETLQYWGKWPFRRVVFVQEFFSSFFSALNFVPHFIFFVGTILPKIRTCYHGSLLEVCASVPWSSGQQAHNRWRPADKSAEGQSHVDLLWVMLAAQSLLHMNGTRICRCCALLPARTDSLPPFF